jgi:alkylation response protein AidB-like acyl-CoA dehydrogenase
MSSTADVLKPDFAAQRRHFIFTDEHEQLRESIRRFVIKELRPHAEEWEETTFPDWVFERMGELGFLGLDKPEEYGGQGGDYYTSLVLAEELAHAHCGGLAMGVAVQTDMALPPIVAFCTEEQKQQWAVPAISGTKILCLGITEPTPAPTSPGSRPAPYTRGAANRSRQLWFRGLTASRARQKNSLAPANNAVLPLRR